MKIAGVDEAGKGPVIGPMCVAAVMMRDDELYRLKELGVRDSKLISPKKRRELSGEIEKIAETIILEVTAHEIDEMRKEMTMNDLAVVSFSKVLQRLRPDKAIVDAVDVNPQRFSENLKKRCDLPIDLISEHKADVNYPIVSAASVIAKVRRDQRIRELEDTLGVSIGSGYPSDPKTIIFIEEIVKKEHQLPDFIRHSWKTIDRFK
ncbi:MAG: ribonuclease HII [Halobacteriota archaeon]|nr:ribonuclease HII [Halobacteriota archaeon]